MRRVSGLKVTGYLFPADTQSTMAAKWLHKLGLERPRVGFTRYFISLKDYQCLREAVPQMKVEDIAAVCYQLRSISAGGDLAHPCGIQSIEGRNGCGTISCQSGDFGTGCVG